MALGFLYVNDVHGEERLRVIKAEEEKAAQAAQTAAAK